MKLKLKNYYLLCLLLFSLSISAQDGTHLHFDGANDYVTIAHNAVHDITTGALTIEAWINPEAGGNIITKQSYGYGLGLEGDGKLFFWDQSSQASAIHSSAGIVAINTNTWQHVAVTVQDNGANLTIYFYVNGVANGPYTSTQAQINNGTSKTLDIGVQDRGTCNCNYFKGSIDDLRLWNVARTATQINDNKDTELQGNESGLVLNYKFNQGTGSGSNAGVTTLYTATANGINGTLTNFALSGSTSNWLSGSPVKAFANLSTLGITQRTAASAYSLRKLRSDYAGYAIQVRRSSDNTTSDIGFTPSGDLDTTALTTFVGSGNGFVSIWYDQSSNARNLAQATQSKQPTIVTNGSVYTKNTKPTLFFDATDDGMVYSGANYMTSNPITVNTVAGSNSSSTSDRRAVLGSNPYNWLIGPRTNQHAWYAGGFNHQISTPWSQTFVEYITVIQPVSANCSSFRNGVAQTSGNNKGVPGKLSLGNDGYYNENLDGYISEVIGYNAELSTTERQSMETSQSSYYPTALSTNANLSALSISSGTLTPVFASSTTAYTASVSNGTASVTVTPTKEDTNATIEVRVNGGSYASVTSGSASSALSLNVGDNTIDVKVTAQDGTTLKTYTITITRELNTIDILGLTSANYAASAYSLRKVSSNYTGNLINVRRSSDNTTQNIGFTLSGDLDLTALQNFVGSGNGFVVTWFDQSGNNRDMSQSNQGSQPTIVNNGSVVLLNNKPAIYFGNNNMTTGNVTMFTAGATMVAYAKGNSTTPSSLVTKTGTSTITNFFPGPFDFTNTPGQLYVGKASINSGNYIDLKNASPRADVSLSVASSVYSFVIPTSGTYYTYRNGIQTGSQTVGNYADEGSPLIMGNRLTGDGSGNFWVSELLLFNDALNSTNRQIVENNIYSNYSLSPNANLSALSISSGTLTPVFASSTIAYTSSVSSGTTSVTVTPTKEDTNATIEVRVNGGGYATVSSGSASSALSLNVGDNTIDVKVTAQDGTTLKTYTITVNRAFVNPANALDFDGTNDFIQCSANLGTLSNFTFETWMSPDINGFSYVISVGDIVGNRKSSFMLSSNEIKWDGQLGGNYLISSGITLQVGTWYHVAAVKSGATVTMYVDGVLVGTVTGNSAESYSNSTILLSSILNNYFYKGKLDEVRIWNVARSVEEINYAKNCELTGSESGLIAYYKFNQGESAGNNTSYTTLTDATANANNGTLTNFALTGATSNWINGSVITTGYQCCPSLTVWNGTTWNNGNPDSNKAVAFSGNYTGVGFDACSVSAYGTAHVIINTAETLNISRTIDVKNTATFEMLNNSVLLQTTEDQNSGNITYHRNSTSMNQFDFAYWGVPVTGEKADVFSDTDKVYDFNQNTQQWNHLNLSVPSSTVDLIKGKGYAARKNTAGTGTQNAAFTGVPNNGDVSLTNITATIGNSVLLGNPYPSAIDLVNFQDYNQNIIGQTFYFWTHTTPYSNGNYANSDYSTYSLALGYGTSGTLGSPAGTRYVAAGQGFFADLKTVSNQTIVFKNAHRVSGNNSTFFRNNQTNTSDKIWFNLTGNSSFKQTLLAYTSSATNGYDPIDATTFDGQPSLDFYSITDAKKLVIQAREPFVNTDNVSLGYRTTQAGTYQIAIDHLDNSWDNQNIYLKDATLNLIHDIKTNPYSFTTNAGVFDNRFEIVYQTNALGTSEIAFENNVIVFANDKNITIQSSLQTIKDVIIYDLQGRILTQKDNINATETMLTNIFTEAQVLFVKVISAEGKTAIKKIIF